MMLSSYMFTQRTLCVVGSSKELVKIYNELKKDSTDEPF